MDGDPEDQLTALLVSLPRRVATSPSPTEANDKKDDEVVDRLWSLLTTAASSSNAAYHRRHRDDDCERSDAQRRHVDDDDNDKESSSLSPWDEFIRRRIGPVLPSIAPHALMRCAVYHRRRVMFDNDKYDGDDGDGAGTPNPTTTNVVSEKVREAILIHLLAVYALREASRQTKQSLSINDAASPDAAASATASMTPSGGGFIGKASTTKTPVRWKRLKSLASDAVALFQNTFLLDLLLLGDDDDREGKNGEGARSTPVAASAVNLWCHHLLPPLVDLLSVLHRRPNMTPASDMDDERIKWRWDLRSMQSALVGTSTKLLAILTFHSCSTSFGGGWAALSSKVVQKFTSLSATVQNMDEVLVLPIKRHRWRRRCRQCCVQPRRSDALASREEDDMESDDEDCVDFDSSDDSDDSEDDIDGGGEKGQRRSAIERHRRKRLKYDPDRLAAVVPRRKCDCSSGGSEGYADMETWHDPFGVAMLAYLLFVPDTDDDGKVHQLFPLVYAPQYRWTMLFLHVSTLLLGVSSKVTSPSLQWWIKSDEDVGGGGSDLDDDASDDGANAARRNGRKRLVALVNDQLARKGMNLLRRLLASHPPSYDDSSSRDNKTRKTRPRGYPSFRLDVQGPLDPSGTLQLLFNRLLLLHSSGGGGGESSSDAASPSGNAMEINSLVRDLLGRYPPVHRARLVATLAERCPHPPLVPRILDALRPSLMLVASSNDDNDDDGDDEKELMGATLSAIRPFLDEMKSRYATAKNESTSEVQSTSNCRIHDAGELLGSMESYASAASLVRLLCLRQLQRRKEVDNGDVDEQLEGAVKILEDFLNALRRELEEWSFNRGGGTDTLKLTNHHPSPPSDYYRLFLLEDALVEAVRTFRGADNGRSSKTT